MYRHWTQHFVYTEGVRQFAEVNGAYWLIDVIASHQSQIKDDRLRDFQLWLIQVQDNAARIQCLADSNESPSIEQLVPYTDLPAGDYKFYVERGYAMTMMLPEER